LTFGYDANWRGASRSVSNISDFAKELLFEMRFAKGRTGEDLGLGSRPILFVVHSMGGLVVKKAFLLGLHDENYSKMVSAISAIVFLSTPHRGSNLAETLNKVLSASFQSPKSFISDLMKCSPAIEELNEQFRHHVPRLSIWSFYETLVTSIGPKKLMVLEKESSVLGYPTEISRSLHADHHDVCKYSTPVDSNYISVRNAISSLAATLRSEADHGDQGCDGDSEESVLEHLSQICPDSEDDYHSIQRNWVPNTCTWVLEDPKFASWLVPDPEARLLWYSAPPANGKSMIAAFMVNHLRKLGLPCQFFFFRHSDHNKRSVASCFRALTYQVANDVDPFRRELSRMPSSTWGLDSDVDPALIWRTMFERILRKTASSAIYWVIDALDECESPRALFECLRSVRDAKLPLRILLLSRNTDTITTGIDRISLSVPVDRVEKPNRDHNKEDIRLFVQQELRSMRGGIEFKESLTEQLLARCEGNFLWTKLVLDEVLRCHTEKDIQEVLGDVPDDMTELYRHMERNLTGSARKSNRPLILTLFQWAVCAQRPLNLKEMSQALQPQFSSFVDLRWTIKDTCGQFLQVQDNGRIDMIHHTAREYLTRTSDGEFRVESRKAHGILFQRTVEVLSHPRLRWTLIQGQHFIHENEPLVYYSAVNWSYHLGHSNQASDAFTDCLTGFFQSPAVLTWIHALAMLGKLEAMVKTSRVIRSYVRTVKRMNASRNPMQHRLTDIQLLEDWSVDLIKIVGKFGSHIVSCPNVVYDVIPALCPGESVLRRTFYSPATAIVRTSGNEFADWNDNLARLTLPGSSKCYKISCAGKHLAVLALGAPGATYVWDTINFTRVCVVEHGEAVVAMVLNARGTMLATYGLKTTKIWSIPSATLLGSSANPRYVKAKTLVFTEGDRSLLLGGDDNIIRAISVEELANGWRILNSKLLKETVPVEGAIINSPMCIAFNNDNNLVGVSYRGAPLSVWSLLDGRCLSRCYRSKSFQDDRRRSSKTSSSSATWWGVDRFTWNPVTDHVLGVYRDGCVFKWHPLTNENVEAPNARADEIAASPDGKLFATSSSNGAVRIWNFAYFTIIYQLSSDDIVAELAFSTDSRRFYDLRGGSVNAWESNSLARFFDQDEQVTSDTNSEDRSTTELSKISEARLVPFETITAFSPTPDGLLYAVSYKNGGVNLFEKWQEDGMDLAKFHSFFDVQHIRWSRDGEYVAINDVSGRMDVISVQRESAGTGELKVSNMPSPEILLEDQNVYNVLFSWDCLHTIIVATNSVFVCSVATGRLLISKGFDNCTSRAWMLHPSQPDLLLAFGQQDMQAYKWQDLELQWSRPYQYQTEAMVTGKPHENSSPVTSMEVEFSKMSVSGVAITATLTQDGKHILFSGNPTLHNKAKAPRVLIFKLDSLIPHEVGPLLRPLGYASIPTEICTRIKVVLGILPGSKLVFLDQDLWICTCSLEFNAHVKNGTQMVQRLYFIPRDWVGEASLDTCVLMQDGTLFWPRNDSVVVIECNPDDSRLAYSS
jgi:WD40 repeat protein